MFCSDLEEEIVHRKYFYKSATLVREGMIIVHNAGLTGDTNNAEVDYHCLLLSFYMHSKRALEYLYILVNLFFNSFMYQLIG